MPKLSSRHRITARIVLALVVVWTVGGFLLLTAVHRQLTNRLDDDLEAGAPGAAAVLETLPTEILDDLPSSLRVIGSNDALIILSPDGEVSSIPSGSTDRPDPLPDLGGRSLAELRGVAGEAFTVGDVAGNTEQYRVVTAPMQNGGVVISARSLGQVEDVMHVLGQVLFLSLLISVAVVFLLVWIIGRQALRPLEDVISTSQQIGAGSLDTRVEVRSSSAPDVERLAESMNNMLGRLQDAFAAKEQSEAKLRQFVGDASHELRTPLAAVIGYAELYQEHMARSPEQVDKMMSRIIAEGTRMQSLVEDLLLLARMDEGRPLERDAVDLHRIVDDAVSAVQVIDHERRFTMAAADGTVEIVGDDVALRQIVDNLLANVVAHTPPGTTAVVALTTEEAHAVITVADDGPGMSEEHRAHAFDRFWRAEQSRSRPGGSGLGLAIVAELIRAQGGSIDLETAPGDGATFAVRFPLA
jgi:two-component system OmpR family sensor kinase